MIVGNFSPQGKQVNVELWLFGWAQSWGLKDRWKCSTNLHLEWNRDFQFLECMVVGTSPTERLFKFRPKDAHSAFTDYSLKAGRVWDRRYTSPSVLPLKWPGAVPSGLGMPWSPFFTDLSSGDYHFLWMPFFSNILHSLSTTHKKRRKAGEAWSSLMQSHMKI